MVKAFSSHQHPHQALPYDLVRATPEGCNWSRQTSPAKLRESGKTTGADAQLSARVRAHVRGDKAHELLCHLLRVNPAERGTADQVLSHAFFDQRDENLSLVSGTVQTILRTQQRRRQ
ncbi:hypothetical protein, variant [Aphanomyces astaci]|uniref:Protein kinase domain-containing protein n=1 Tax=Aphanomyces astaci TaxID=112090 RepID=W4G109_APHAT|nr:hypothetical protein H257_12356 [Aphanomyces astaci]XP_009837826.1 hypothetical protein, variant [Aphanomyces astaci]ETV72597.1 hypothetical protein H257_12356 [Aphanomyces astaci]ETV72598.1 hypothetical protein, variant [Aphanomyces astaci]|eukprot:XP_009837825.1 hypothetical protein H257_12356 [Aphanomyces astaci]